jgi:hypothetical protein
MWQHAAPMDLPKLHPGVPIKRYEEHHEKIIDGL